ncbi:MAG TPA: Mur ligase domain-containing protein, partial [Clostridia bacterium]|nr:Mur ligase domain-containing protein [Clostridia bacterium]
MSRLKQLLKAIEIKSGYYENKKALVISGISYHSQKVEEGHIFVCIKGYKTDGHKYLGQAVANGAIAAVVEDFQENIKIPQYVVENSRSALARLGAAFYDNPSQKMKMIGITATNGKTTTAFMTDAILGGGGLKTGLLGT